MPDGDGAPVEIEPVVGNLEASNWADGLRSTLSAWAANASWTSPTPISSGAIPAPVMTFVIAHAGAMPIRPASKA
jgi:hypothetical protein